MIIPNVLFQIGWKAPIISHNVHYRAILYVGCIFLIILRVSYNWYRVIIFLIK